MWSEHSGWFAWRYPVPSHPDSCRKAMMGKKNKTEQGKVNSSDKLKSNVK